MPRFRFFSLPLCFLAPVAANAQDRDDINNAFDHLIHLDHQAFVAGIFAAIAACVCLIMLKRRYRGRRDWRAKRYKTFIQTAIGVGDIEVMAIVLDLSCNGAKLQIKTPIGVEIRDRVHVFINDEWKAAELTWQDQPPIRLRFENGLTTLAVKHLRKQRIEKVLSKIKTAP